MKYQAVSGRRQVDDLLYAEESATSRWLPIIEEGGEVRRLGFAVGCFNLVIRFRGAVFEL